MQLDSERCLPRVKHGIGEEVDYYAKECWCGRRARYKYEGEYFCRTCMIEQKPDWEEVVELG